MANVAKNLLSKILLIMMLNIISVLAHATTFSDEYALKALYIFNFAKFTDWPIESFQSEESTLDFCVLGENPFGVTLDEIGGKKVRNRTLTIRQFPRVGVVSSCHILFISRSERSRLKLILDELGQLPILTISDIEVFSQQGGMVTLLVEDQVITFAVNPEAAAQTGIKISSKLLELASLIVSKN